MKQGLVILLVAGLFIGCAKHAKTKKMGTENYDYLFAGDLVPVNSDEERTKVLKKAGISNLNARE